MDEKILPVGNKVVMSDRELLEMAAGNHRTGRQCTFRPQD